MYCVLGAKPLLEPTWGCGSVVVRACLVCTKFWILSLIPSAWGKSPDFQLQGSIFFPHISSCSLFARILKHSATMHRREMRAEETLERRVCTTRLPNLDWSTAQPEKQFLD